MKKKINPSTLEKRKFKTEKKEILNNDEVSSSCPSSSTSNPNSTRRVSRVVHRFRNPTVRLGMARRSVGERQAEALALPLGMSFAVFANLVLKRSAAGQNVYVDDLAVISASAVKESLANVYGYKLGSFETNFKRSFKSTLRILKLTNEYAFPQHLNNDNVASSTIYGCSDTKLSAMETSSVTSAYEEIQGGARTMNEIVLHEETRQLYAVPRSSAMSLTTFERRFLEEQVRANDLKTMEIGLTRSKLGLKETQVAISSESNNMKKAKLEMGVSKAAFRDEKFKTELEDTKRDDLVRRTMDWLGVSVFIMLAFMLYGASVFSQQKIKEATSICDPSEEKSSHWWGLSWLNTEFNILICRVEVWAKYSSGFLMILVFTYFIIQRSSGTNQTRPVTFIVLFLGIVCGLAGKFCVDALGGNGELWLCLWETFCLLHFVANAFTLRVHGWIYGPITTVTQGTRSSRCNNNTKVPYWARRCFVFGVIRFVLPAITGILAFATFGEWRDHCFGGRGSQV